MGHTFLNAHGDALQIDAPAQPEGQPVKLTDEAGREIGTAVVVDGRIQATVTDPAMAARLRHDHTNISINYRVVVALEPASARAAGPPAPVVAGKSTAGQIADILRTADPSMTVAARIEALDRPHRGTRPMTTMLIGTMETHMLIRTAEEAREAFGAGSPLGEHAAALIRAGHGPIALVRPPASDEILPCPFCRCATITVGVGPGETRPRCVCSECGARGPQARSDASREAIANWNRRPQPGPPGERHAAGADLRLVPVFESREGRERGDVSDLVASCEPSRLVTIKEFTLTDESPGISVGFTVDSQQVKAMRDRVQAQRAVAQEPPLGACVLVTTGEHAGFVGTVQPRDDDDPPGWSRVRRDDGYRETRLFQSIHLALAG